jgi:predicted regulator of Ras-like GTPase activity (Roadblock/LC7/MglB family)
MWNHVRSQPGWDPVERPALPGLQEFPAKVSELASPAPAVTAPGAGSRALDVDRAKVALASMLMLDGLLGCAVVDSTTGLVLAHESREDEQLDLELAAAACTQVLRAQRVAARSMGLAEPIEEVLTIAGMRQQVMRTLSRHPELFLFALLDKQGTNLALARFKLMEVERDLS